MSRDRIYPCSPGSCRRCGLNGILELGLCIQCFAAWDTLNRCFDCTTGRSTTKQGKANDSKKEV